MRLIPVLDVVLLGSTALLAFDNLRMRRKLRVDRLAQEAQDALGPPRIGDIDMPDPSDPRWTLSEQSFFVNGVIESKEHVLMLEKIMVDRAYNVFIGAGPPLENSQHYGKRVFHAYKRRLAEQARGSST